MKGMMFRNWKAKLIGESDPGTEWVTRRVVKPQPPDDARLISACNTYSLEIDGGFQALPPARYQPNEIVYLNEGWWQDDDGDVFFKSDWIRPDGTIIQPSRGKWESPLLLKAIYARYFGLILEVSAERLELPLSGEELKLEGGEQALEILEKIKGLWVFRYLIRRVKK